MWTAIRFIFYAIVLAILALPFLLFAVLVLAIEMLAGLIYNRTMAKETWDAIKEFGIILKELAAEIRNEWNTAG